MAVSLAAADFESGGLPRESYVDPWTVVPVRHADVHGEEGRLVEATTAKIAQEAASYLGVRGEPTRMQD